MAGISLDLTEDELKILELEVYPSFVQAQQNCGEWYGSSKDYEPIADLFSMLSFLGKEGYAYDPPTLFRFLVVHAADEEFSLDVDEIGCVKSLFKLFISYDE